MFSFAAGIVDLFFSVMRSFDSVQSIETNTVTDNWVLDWGFFVGWVCRGGLYFLWFIFLNLFKICNRSKITSGLSLLGCEFIF